MRSSRLAVAVLLLAACSGDTFVPVPAGVGTAGTTGAAGTDGVAGSDGIAGTTGQGGGEAGAAGSAEGGGSATTQGGDAGSGGSGGTNAGAAGGPNGAGAGGTKAGGGGSAGAAGAAGAAGMGGKSGAAGSTSANGCVITLPDVAPVEKKCGNGVVEAGEMCDDGETESGDGCSDKCQIECAGGVVANEHCYFALTAKRTADEVYSGPKVANEPNDLVRPNWNAEPCGDTGVGTHLVMFETKSEHAGLLAATGFKQRIGDAITNVGAWVGAGARFRSDLPLTSFSTWRNGEGGQVPEEIWKAKSPSMGDGRCATMTPLGPLDNVECHFPNGAATSQRISICEREAACSITDATGPHVGYVGYAGPVKHCYARFPTPEDLPVTRQEAVETCTAAGAHLAAFENAAEMAGVTGANLTSGDVWAGLQRQACAGDAFVWDTLGTAVNPGGAVWADAPGPTEKCATMGRNRLLSSVDCATKAFVLCERDY